MADKTLTARYVLDSAGIKRGVADASRSMDQLSTDAKDMGDRFDEHTSRIGGMFQNLGQQMGNLGLPFGESMSKIGDDLDKAKSSGSGYSKVLSDIGGVAAGALAGGLVVAGAESVRMAANFQESMTQLVTGAGESKSNLGLVSSGILSMAGQVGESSSQLASGMYMIESAGYHGASGLKVLKAAAEGAKVGGADLGTVADAVTTALNNYHLPATEAATVTSQLVETVALGKTHMEDLAGSLGSVLPAAASAHIGLGQVLGAMSTMTATGTNANEAATYLRQTILQLSNPSAKAAAEMASLGLSSTDVASHLGQRGLTGTLNLLTTAIANKMGPAGLVLVQNLKSAAAAGSGWQAKLAQMTPAQQKQIDQLTTQGVAMAKYKQQLDLLPASAQSLVATMSDGAVVSKSQTQALDALSPAAQAQVYQLAQQAGAYRAYTAQVAALPAQYQTVLKGSIASKQGFVDLKTTLSNLAPTQQTFVGALATMVGGTKSMQAALELTGGNAATFDGNVAKISSTTADAKGRVQGFAETQKDLNQQLAQVKGTVEALGIRFGDFLIPKVEAAGKAISELIGWFQQHKLIAEALGIVIGGFLTLAIGVFTINKIGAMIKGVQSSIEVFGQFKTAIGDVATTVLQKFGIISQGSEQMTEQVTSDAESQAEKVAASATQQADAVAQQAATGAAKAEASAVGMETQVTGAAQSMATKVGGDVESLATTVEGETAGMASKVEADVGTLAGAVEGEFGGMAGAVDGEVSTMAEGVEARVGAMDAAVEGEVGAMDAAVEGGGLLAGGGGLLGGVGGSLLGLANPANLLAGAAGLTAWGLYSGIQGNGPAHGSQMGLLGPNPSGSGINPSQIPTLTPGEVSGLTNLQNLPPGQLAGLATGFKKGAAGGLITEPTLGLFGEAGPELVLPLNDQERAMSLLAGAATPLTGPTGRVPAAGAAGGAGGGVTINVTVQGSVLTEQNLVDALHQGLLNKGAINGTLFGVNT